MGSASLLTTTDVFNVILTYCKMQPTHYNDFLKKNEIKSIEVYRPVNAGTLVSSSFMAVRNAFIASRVR